MTAESIREALEECCGDNCRSEVRRLAKEFENDLLKVSDFPDEYFGLLLYVLSSPKLTQYRGVEQFALNAYLDIDKTTAIQRSQLMDCLVSNFNRYRAEELQLVAVDIIARKYPADRAASAFESLLEAADADHSDSIIVGIQTLAKNNKADPTFQAQLKVIVDKNGRN